MSAKSLFELTIYTNDMKASRYKGIRDYNINLKTGTIVMVFEHPNTATKVIDLDNVHSISNN
jgi:sporulation protein YlmC with PRC-barrel domain